MAATRERRPFVVAAVLLASAPNLVQEVPLVVLILLELAQHQLIAGASPPRHRQVEPDAPLKQRRCGTPLPATAPPLSG